MSSVVGLLVADWDWDIDWLRRNLRMSLIVSVIKWLCWCSLIDGLWVENLLEGWMELSSMVSSSL